MADRFVPVNTPLLTGNEKKYLNECIETGWISSEGPFVEEFERKFSNYIGRKYGIAVSNGTAALEIAAKALGLMEGDEVIVPTFTIISPVQAIVKLGCKPVWIDSEPRTWNIDTDLIEAAITAKTKAIIAVHTYGLPVDVDPVLDLAKRYDLLVLEDAAEMHGQTYKGVKCGNFGDVSAFSFYPNKHITTGEGGMILTDREEIAEKCRSFRNLCFEPKRRFVHEELGWNYRITNLQAAVGVAQLERIDEFVARKREIGRLYTEKLKDLPHLTLPLNRTEYAENIYWIYGIVLDREKDVQPIMNFLKEKGIGTRPFFWCMHEQPVLQRMGFGTKQRYPVAEKLARNGFYVPCGLALKNEEIDIVVKSLEEFLLKQSGK